MLENVAVDGTARLYYTEGRTVNPGHDIEGVWFLLEYARRTGNAELVARAEEIFRWAITAGGIRNTADYCTLLTRSASRPRRTSTT